MITLGVAGGAALLILLLLGSYDEASVNSDWETILTPAGIRAYQELRERFDHEATAIRFSYLKAAQAHGEGDVDEAVRLLGVGYEYLALLAPSRDALLDGLKLYARMCSAIVPLPALRPRAFQLPKLATLPGLGMLGHHISVTIPRRLHLRIWLLRRGLGIAMQALLHGTRREKRGQPAPDWTQVLAARTAFNTISEETVESFGAMVSAIARQPVARTQALQRVH
jgi:hypothetical protein